MQVDGPRKQGRRIERRREGDGEEKSSRREGPVHAEESFGKWIQKVGDARRHAELQHQARQHGILQHDGEFSSYVLLFKHNIHVHGPVPSKDEQVFTAKIRRILGIIYVEKAL